MSDPTPASVGEEGVIVGDEEAFYKTLISLTKFITLDCKTLIQLSNDKGREDEIYDTSTSAVHNSSKLMELVQHYVARNTHKEKNKQILLQYLQESTKTAKSAVAEFIRAVRAAAANPFDYMTRQKLKNCSAAVADSIKASISILDSLKNDHGDPSTTASTPPNPSSVPAGPGSGPTTPTTQPPSPLAGAFSADVPGLPTSSLPSVDPVTGEPTPRLQADHAQVIEPYAKQIVVHVEKLREAAKQGEHKGVVEALRAISSATSEVLKEAKDNGVGGDDGPAVSERLREATIAVISSARVVLKNPNDKVYVAQLDSAGVKLAEAISMMLYAARTPNLPRPTGTPSDDWGITLAPPPSTTHHIPEPSVNTPEPLTTAEHPATNITESPSNTQITEPSSTVTPEPDKLSDSQPPPSLLPSAPSQAAVALSNKSGEQLKHVKSADDISMSTVSSYASTDDTDTSTPTTPIAIPHSIGVGSDEDERLPQGSPLQRITSAPVTSSKPQEDDASHKKSKTTDVKKRDKRTSFLSSMFRKKDTKDESRHSPPLEHTHEEKGSRVRFAPSTPTSPPTSPPPSSPSQMSDTDSIPDTPIHSPPLSPSGGSPPSSSPKRQVSLTELFKPKKENSGNFTMGLSLNANKLNAKNKVTKDGASKILNLLLDRFPAFKQEWQGLSHDATSKVNEQLASMVGDVAEEYSRLFSHGGDGSTDGSVVKGAKPANPSDSLTDLQKLAEKNIDYSEWARMTLRYKMSTFGASVGRSRKRPETILPFNLSTEPADEGGEVSEDNATEHELMASVTPFAESVVELVIFAYESVYDASKDKDSAMLQNAVKGMGKALQQVLTQCGALGRFDPEHRISKILEGALNAVKGFSSQTRGRLDDGLIAAASGSSPMRPMAESSLELRIYNESNGARVLAVQFMATMIATSANRRENTNYLQIAATAKALVHAVGRLLDAVETKRFLAMSPAGMEKDFELDSSPLALLPTNDCNIWEEPSDSSTLKQEMTTDEGGKTSRLVIRAATLNKLVEILTSEKNYDTPFMKTFMLTYQSFTTPPLLLEKLLQRYNVPPSCPEDRRIQVQLRVAEVLKIWMERNFVDIDNRVAGRIREFITDRLEKDGHDDLVRLLGGALQRRLAERTARMRFIQTIPVTDMSVPEGQLSPVALFLALNESEIARQLTLIEFKIFEAIEPTELLNLSWNKAELQHRAPNVLDMISRGNRLSFWVASMILWLESIEERCKMIVKFITIATHVAQLNNFSTLMGILAGLNMSSITRLRKTFNEIPTNHMQSFAALEKTMSFSMNYKNYRQALHKSTPPSLPYIGTYLSDLTFIEDGNPDRIGNLINWQKRELVHKLIVEIQQYQTLNYKFPVVEPINTFLTELPSLTDKELYDLSVSLEPRDPNQKNKNMYATLTKKKSKGGL